MAVDVHRIMNITQNHAHVELSHRSAYSIYLHVLLSTSFSVTLLLQSAGLA